MLAVDADPNNCLGRALGFPDDMLDAVTPLSEMKDELTALAGTAEGGSFFALNPPVEGLLERYQLQHDGITLLVMGTVDEPGAGCVCPESAVLKALVRYLAGIDELTLVMDMEAGLEHLGRGTALYIGALLIVTEPTVVSARTAARVARLARGLGLTVPGAVLNKAASADAEKRMRPYLEEIRILASLPYDASVADSEAVPESGSYVDAVDGMLARLESLPRAGVR